MAPPAPSLPMTDAPFLAEVKKDVEDLAKEPSKSTSEPQPGPEFEEKDIEGVSWFFRFSNFCFLRPRPLLSHSLSPLLPSLHPSQIRASLLAWYDANHRVLPWRRNPHSKLPKKEGKEGDKEEQGAPLDLPLEKFIYGVWVCEVMSQQTQLDRVKAYWRAWMERWPDVASLAAATEDRVREAWAGLGYYRRAAFLLKGARYVSEELGGSFPREEDGLKKIPGVGAYTSAAIASIACGRKVAVVDGNVMRVLSRLRALAVADPKAAAAAKQYATIADSLVDPERPGDFNQAMMELGATVCVPNTRPNCSKCPVRAHCAARAQEIKTQGTVSVTDFPTKSEKAAKREETVDVCVVEIVHSNAAGSSLPPSVLLQKRPEGGLLAGLWEFPSVAVSSALAEVKKTASSSRRAAVDDHVSRLLGGVPLPSSSSAADVAAPSTTSSSPYKLLRREQLGEIVHVFSHIRMTLSVEHVRLELASDSSSLSSAILSGAEVAADDDEDLPARRWVPVSGMAEEKVSSSVAKCWKLVSEGKGSSGASAPASNAGAAATKRAAPVDPEVARKETGGGIKRFFQPAVKKAA